MSEHIRTFLASVDRGYYLPNSKVYLDVSCPQNSKFWLNPALIDRTLIKAHVSTLIAFHTTQIMATRIASSPLDAGPSIVASKFRFDPSLINTDSTRWNKSWEKALRSLVSDPPKRVLDLFGDSLLRIIPQKLNVQSLRTIRGIKDKLHECQSMTINLYNDLNKGGHFRTAWMLLDDKERKKHIQHGLQEACECSRWKQDARALCPEITLTKISKDEGRAFFTWINEYLKGLKDALPETYFVPNEWWERVITSRGTSLVLTESMAKFMTLLRNEFIAIFACHVGMSLLKDFAQGSPGMNSAVDIMNSDPLFSSFVGVALESTRSKPIIRCENCTKSPDMIEGNPKFKICSVCKSRLDFVIHYCSHACQKEDWPNHRKHCGEQKISKKLKGTINDPYWIQPLMPDYARTLNVPRSENGISLDDLGFATMEPSHPYSPALQRQVSLLNANKQVDYFLFDANDRPICIFIPDTFARMSFRHMRSVALSPEPMYGVAGLGEHLLKRMSNHPRLSRHLILEQLTKEFGDDTTANIVMVEESLLDTLNPESANSLADSSFVERTGKSVTTMMAKTIDGRKA
ncbi:hypothetical protein Hypma_012236 [Hypsizygus marmoreus]|uniref:MYND-type domain-containing protein n=1 Tax=Hypsizygus marmoreus TaxID=39966 RepID=A0A369JHB6_HYPMA|nr:hypothetical protein Hypma_012236 [Hypsizygus marmoreus]